MAHPSSDTAPHQPPAVHLQPDDVARTLDVFQEATFAVCRDIYRDEGVTYETFQELMAELGQGALSHATAAKLSPRARRTLTAHVSCADIAATRRRLRAEGEHDALLTLETVFFNAIQATHFMAHMGEDQLGAIEGLAELRMDRASRSYGGKKGNVSRIKWQVEARERFDLYRSRNPHISQPG